MSFDSMGCLWLRSQLACRLTSLRKLSLQSNRLTSMAGFEHCIHLEELYLSHNGISKVEVRVLQLSMSQAPPGASACHWIFAAVVQDTCLDTVPQQVKSCSLSCRGAMCFM